MQFTQLQKEGVKSIEADCVQFLQSGTAGQLQCPEIAPRDLYDVNMANLITSSEKPSAEAQCQPIDQFHNLVQELSGYIDTAESLAFSEICDPNAVIQRMKQYQSYTREWARYAYRDEAQCFTRNMVDRGLGKSNILILVWTPGKESPIHDHADSHCVMKVLQGSLKETQYNWPKCPVIEESQHAPLQVKGSRLLMRNDVTYISDKHGLHKLLNPDGEEYAVTLHLYAPPNAAKEGCQVFDEETGKANHVIRYDLYSEMGQRVK